MESRAHVQFLQRNMSDLKRLVRLNEKSMRVVQFWERLLATFLFMVLKQSTTCATL